ncbi:MAG: CoA pyrophosphatase [Steroidobacteraceae bacterium]
MALPTRDPAGLRALVEDRLRGSSPGGDPFAALARERTAEEIEMLRTMLPATFSRAAVLVPIVEQPGGLTVLLTERASHLKHHAGQISFPGGRIEPSDRGPWEAALRETEEEIGLPRGHVTHAGWLGDHIVVSGYVVTPAVGFVRPGYELSLDRTEVQSVFEVPLAYALDAANYVARERTFAGRTFRGHDLPYEGRNIWGATAVMLGSLRRALGLP